MVLAHDSSIGALQEHQQKIYVKQVHHGDLKVVLAKFKTFLKTTSRLSEFA